MSALVRLDGERIYLRPVLRTDVNDTYAGWLADNEVTRYLESRFTPATKQSIAEFVDSISSSADNVFLAIMLREGDRHIGNIKLGPINRHHRTSDIGLMIGERDCWGKGYATEAIALVADYGFSTLGLHKLTAGCYAPNEGSARAFEKAGFTREGLRRSQFLSGGGYVDEILLGRVNEAPA